jgi:hypothetical protein
MEKLIDPDRAQKDAENLFEAGVDRFGTDEEDFIRIFALRDTYQLRETYKNMTGTTASSNLSGDNSALPP